VSEDLNVENKIIEDQGLKENPGGDTPQPEPVKGVEIIGEEPSSDHVKRLKLEHKTDADNALTGVAQ
jgi:hypothetical protein